MAPAALEKEDHQRDAEFNRALHGKSVQSNGGLFAMRKKDSKAQQAAIDEYFKHWDNKPAEEETEATREVSKTNHPSSFSVQPSLLPENRPVEQSMQH
jgi:sterol 24-C-methyltransferase